MTDRQQGIDPIRLEVIRNALVAASEEMSITIWRTSRSTVVREILDFSTAVFDANGNNIAQSARIPVHLNSMSDCLRTILDRFIPLEQWQDGDVIVTNDPYSGGQHLPDIQTFRPVFVDGKRVAIVGTLCHHVDVGGGAAGSYYANATEIFHEGIRIPPLRLVDKGVLNSGVFEMLLHNLRQPDETRGDLNAQIAALGIGERAVARMARKYGAASLEAAMAAILDGSEAMMRAALKALPDGEASFVELVDDDGQSEEPITLAVRITKRGDTIALDFEGSSPQVRGPVNNTPAMTCSAVYYALLAALGGDIPANSGCYRPVTVTLPEGSVVNAVFPAPVAGRMVVNHRIATAVFGALAGIMPERIPAAYYAISYVYALQTANPQGKRQVYFDIEVGGWGGHAGGDGASALSCGLHNNTNAPIEMVEAKYPVTFTKYGLIPDSGGAGQFRGGLGLVREWRLDAAEGSLSTNFERFRHAPYGIKGGAPGSLSRTTVTHPDGSKASLRSKVSGIPLKRGDIVTIETSGGGGYGDPARRDPQRLARDLAEGLVTPDSAASLYGRGEKEIAA
ncbi:hydantoinase B/oxoprolinase family protein [Bosea sp. (in: a-proteobacteria)]|uniref:hydantoinase B/oxoprolinase family protein n=1 Tax=Bosea sp. (in: a-proteobacteria) TaxID=1871050 RepID=UPI0012186FCC|nr:hydantoinase B/oxoprolinase family protein [Bosea sp. (in: a-proteobacteria)]TAJ27434.1 MAG: hydantoinase B/oxoprolinase family protein [Bosea sp. (in: a-proteobacteria)]